jgi:hypothetical protein
MTTAIDNKIKHPASIAKAVAQVLDRDPLAAGLVKEYLGVERLIRVLDLPPPDFESIEEAFPQASVAELRDLVSQWVQDNPE